MKKFIYNETELTYEELRTAFPRTSFPSLETITQKALPGGVTLVEYEPPASPELTLEELKAEKAQEVRYWANEQMMQLQEGYSDLEITTFDQQKSGADDILAGVNSINAQFVTDLLAERLGITPTEQQTQAFAQLIINNWTAARNATVKIAGTQQRLELLIRDVETKEQFDVVVESVDAELLGFSLTNVE